MTAPSTPMNQPAAPEATQPPEQDENKLIAERRDKLKTLREAQAAGGAVAFPNDFKPQGRAAALHQAHGGVEKETFESELAAGRQIDTSIAGRMMLKRVMGRPALPRCKTPPAACRCM